MGSRWPAVTHDCVLCLVPLIVTHNINSVNNCNTKSMGYSNRTKTSLLTEVKKKKKAFKSFYQLDKNMFIEGYSSALT